MITNARKLRKRSTPAEKHLWGKLRGKQLSGLKFRRQHPITPYIVDFYCAEVRLVIEIDGEIHQFQQDQDQFREDWLKAQGLTVIRFTNSQVLNNINWVLIEIQKICSSITAINETD
ncbi:MAG: restriction endonuclease [Anaerolineaceae bacterium]|nr:restriction endonuclease [Anaerolineaceae bacterium]